jgi:hypothetical protein
VSTSRRYQLRLSAELALELEGFAQRLGLSLGQAIQLLIGRSLHADAQATPVWSPDSPAALAALTAAEHAVLMVASILPEGERRMGSLAQRATEAAGERLALFRPPSPSPEELL